MPHFSLILFGKKKTNHFSLICIYWWMKGNFDPIPRGENEPTQISITQIKSCWMVDKKKGMLLCQSKMKRGETGKTPFFDSPAKLIHGMEYNSPKKKLKKNKTKRPPLLRVMIQTDGSSQKLPWSVFHASTLPKGFSPNHQKGWVKAPSHFLWRKPHWRSESQKKIRKSIRWCRKGN